MTQDREFQREHPSTHKFPDFPKVSPPSRRRATGDGVQMGPECGGPSPMTCIWDFVQQGHNFIVTW
jgi:hypothetical protein